MHPYDVYDQKVTGQLAGELPRFLNTSDADLSVRGAEPYQQLRGGQSFRRGQVIKETELQAPAFIRLEAASKIPCVALRR